MSFLKTLSESPVGHVGRTTKNDAMNHINDNPELISEFRKIVRKLGGKTIALQLLDTMKFTKQQDVLKESKDEKPEDILRSNGYKIKLVIGTAFGTEIKLVKPIVDKEEIENLLKDFDIKFKDQSIFIID